MDWIFLILVKTIEEPYRDLAPWSDLETWTFEGIALYYFVTKVLKIHIFSILSRGLNSWILTEHWVQVFKVLLGGDSFENLELFSSVKSNGAFKDSTVNMYYSGLWRVFIQFIKQLTDKSPSGQLSTGFYHSAFPDFRWSLRQIKLEIFSARITGKKKTWTLSSSHMHPLWKMCQ